ncbi:LPS export ABC transporter permease LptG [Acidithiobacillus sp. CV18-2]|uniref:LPS export ABC transporter permease LptG n=1 Tax=Igneacidithiobacillus copahuensis TaxID=2724909 RepID=A0AAE2YS64_9PROT|nr:LPS export ABC transporter permease LptG [Igneacidithiobacillus copahuensis]MBU2753411.1 LPS export ABC transporter permease LptG [Acidithiobacillus sp. CV18-3]MBU2756441.1 LPS export ABC transporter permease LptG [Acidithiobacillus sp. BN09-2]MBU2776228.1 LPS export ABC transporter permease LptG [Acidithiobacillus sp. CV18-2]MBU2795644.1 LPS export ABC transporter permease LptG [Acidithiobacillus sp. VAN18-2]MBU2798356.1 LPS export ABC transporter permease LptG [Acidithiobacillus sp. VAN18
MKRADALLFRGMLFYSGLVLIILLAMVFVAQLIAKASGPGHGHWSTGLLFRYVALQMPETAYTVIPLALLIGALIWISMLNSHSEITALRMAGWSLARLQRPLLVVGLLGTILMFALGQWIVPYSALSSELLWANAGTHNFQALGDGGLWLRQGRTLIRIQLVGGNGTQLRQIRIYYPQSGMVGIDKQVDAEAASYQNGHWTLQGVREYRLEERSVQVLSAARRDWSVQLQPETLRSFAHRTRTMTLQTLWRNDRDLQGGVLAMNRFALAFWQRITYPWVGLIMILLVVPMVVRNPRAGGAYYWIAAGLALGISFHFLTQMSGFISVAGGIPPSLATLSPMALYAALAWFLFRRHG